MLGSIFEREAITLPRKSRHFASRVLFLLSLYLIVCTAWLLLAGIQPIVNLGDLSRFGSSVFQIIAPLQLVILMCVAALAGATAVSQEKDKRTFLLLLMTSLRNWEIVIGKMSAGWLTGLNLLLAGMALLVCLPMFGGVSMSQVGLVGWISLGVILASGAWGTTIALWREKTFQAITISLLGIVLWGGVCELVASRTIPFVPESIATIANPLRAILAAVNPIPEADSWFSIPLASGGLMVILAFVLAAISIARLRVWNPSREARPKNQEEESTRAQNEVSGNSSEIGSSDLQSPSEEIGAEVSYRNPARWKARDAKRVWDNPVLWREMCTWAYGKKVLLIRFGYIALAALVVFGLVQSISTGTAIQRSTVDDTLVPETARLLTPLFIVSLIIINALAVNSITNERDGQALDLLLVTEITPPGFLFGKLFGVLFVCKEMVLIPMAVCVWLWTQGGMNGENLVFILTGLIVMDVFVAMLGIHCGMIYSQSRSAIGTSLGTVFFLFLGVMTCMLIMISFRGSFGRQLAPFLTIILGGGTGLYVALGYRNPSPAITISSFGLPFLTFFAITSFILRDQELTVFCVVVAAYGFTTLAMMVPALSEFEFAFGRSQAANNEG